MESKPRLTMLLPDEKADLLAHADDLAYPRIVLTDRLGVSYVDADEMRKWRASTSTSGENHGS